MFADLEPTEIPDVEKVQGAEPEKAKEAEKEKPAKKRPGKVRIMSTVCICTIMCPIVRGTEL